MPTVADVERNPSDGSRARGPCEAPIARRGSERNGFVSGSLNLRYEFWERVILRGHPQETQLLSGLKGGASAFEFITEEYRGIAVGSPYRQDASTPSSYGRKLQLYFNMEVR